MDIYAIYTLKDDKNRDPLIIKQKYSIIAGIFGPFWALYHKMWAVFLVVLAVNFLWEVLAKKYELLHAFSVGTSVFMISFFTFFASELKEYYAKKRGYILFDIIAAPSIEEAELKYFNRLT